MSQQPTIVVPCLAESYECSSFASSNNGKGRLIDEAFHMFNLRKERAMVMRRLFCCVFLFICYFCSARYFVVKLVLDVYNCRRTGCDELVDSYLFSFSSSIHMISDRYCMFIELCDVRCVPLVLA